MWDDEQKKWYFSIVDVCGVLTDSPNPRSYWKVLKHRLLKEGNQTVTNCNQLKLRANDGKMRMTDVADTEQLFRLSFTFGVTPFVQCKVNDFFLIAKHI